MATITCSNFLKRNHISSYDNGRYLLTAHGQFLELYDLDEYFKDDFDAHNYKPIRTRVFEMHNVYQFTVFEDTGDVLAVTTSYDMNKRELFVRACLIPRGLILSGGYADPSSVHELFRGRSLTTVFSMATIPGTSEVLVLTDSVLAHFRFHTEDGVTATMERVSKFDLQTILPAAHKRLIVPLCVDSSSSYAILISANRVFVLLKKEGNQWTWRAMRDTDATELAMFIPGTDIAVAAGKKSTMFLSTSSIQPRVNKNQLRFIHKQDNTATKALTYCKLNEDTCAFLFGRKDLTVWKVDKQAITLETTFAHAPKNVEQTKLDGARDELDYMSHPPHRRREIKKATSDSMNENPISAIVMKHNLDNSTSELLITSYESGAIKVFKLRDIIKENAYERTPFGVKEQPVKSHFPCWEFPLDPNRPLTRLAGLSNGAPIVMQMQDQDNTWMNTEICEPGSVSYSHVKWGTAPSGETLAVFYNRKNLCFCIFDKKIRCREDQLDCDIKQCFISGNYVCIRTSTKLVIVDIFGLFNKEDGVQFSSVSIDFETLGIDKKETNEIGSTSVTNEQNEHENETNMAAIYFKCGKFRKIKLSELPISQETSLQDIHNGPFTGTIAQADLCITPIVDMAAGLDGHFWLTDKGVLCIEAIDWNNGLHDYLPKSAKIDGFITIVGETALDSVTFVLARDKDRIYLKDAATLDDITSEPIPPKFGTNPIFGHFVGPSKNGRCVLYTTVTREDGVPLMMRVEARVSRAREKEILAHRYSLFQPDTVAQLVPHKNNKGKQAYFVVSSQAKFIEVQELNKKGTVMFKKEFELRTEANTPIFVVSFNTFYVHSTDTLYIIAASSFPEMKIITWNWKTGEEIITDLSFQSNHAQCQAVSFMGREHSTDPPMLFVYMDTEAIRVVRYDHEARTTDILSEFTRRANSPRSKLDNILDNPGRIICFGDNEIHNVWTLDNHEAILQSGRNSTFEKTLQYQFVTWRGVVQSICSISTRKNETGLYADFVLLVKNRGQLGIIGSLQKIGELPEAVVFGELMSCFNSSIEIDCEVINSSVEAPDHLIAEIRVFATELKGISIWYFKLSVNRERIKVLKVKELGKTKTMITNPSEFVVAKMGESDTKSARFGIVAGLEGTAVVRICPKKLLPPPESERSGVPITDEVRAMSKQELQSLLGSILRF